MNKLMWERKQKPRGSHCFCSFYLQAEERVQHFILRASLFSPVFTPGHWGHQTTPNIAQNSFINKSSGQKDSFKASVVTEEPPQCCMGGVSGLTRWYSLKGHLKGECDSHIGNCAETEKRSGTIVSTLMLRDPSEFRVGSQHPGGVFMLLSNFKNVFTF